MNSWPCRLLRPGALALLAFTCLLALGAPRVARAEGIGLVVAGEPGKAPYVTDAIAPWLGDHGHEVKLGLLPDPDLKKLVDCFLLDDEACARPIIAAAAAGLPRVAFIMIQVDRDAAGNDAVTLTGWLFVADGAVRAAERRQCDACRLDALGQAATGLITAMMTATDAGTATLSLTSSPPGATVAVDGAPVGATPTTYQVAAGTHQVTFTLDGHTPVTHDVTITVGEVKTLDAPLAPAGPGAGKGGRGPSRTLPYALIGGGAAALLAGVVLVVMDEDVPGPGSPSAPRPTTYRDSALPGFGLALLGGAAAGAGVYLLTRSPGKTSGPTAAIAPGSAVLGWAGSF
jgi:plastocyanin